jgi:glutamate---cysteine ligase / carboxylate-amine ligase
MHGYRFGIEEEYFLVNRTSGAARCELPKHYMTAAQKRLGNCLTTELLQSQIEVATPPLSTSGDAIAELSRYRSVLAELGKERGIGIIAAGTHPLAQPLEQQMTRKRRYSKVISDLGMVGLGNPISGLHVHVEVPEPNQRVEIMHRLVPFLPLLLALSTSSPFWCGHPTGLLGYRNAANDALPRTGFPEMFRNLAEYETYVRTLVDAGIVPNATYVWWALRPSLQHPTLELRITDCCTAIADSVAIAALFRAMVRHTISHPRLNANHSAVQRALAEENRWRAQRYGTDGTYIDLHSLERVSFRSWLELVVGMLADDIETLGIADDVQHLKSIQKRGTSAHLQLEYYRSLRKFGRSPREASDVTKWLRISSEAGDFTAHTADRTQRTASLRNSAEPAVPKLQPSH